MAETYRYKPLRYFVLVFVLTWLPWWVAAWCSYRPGTFLLTNLLSLIGLLGPFIAALIMILGSGNPALKTDFRDRLFRLGRIRPLYVPILLLLMPFALLLATWLSVQLGRSPDQFRYSAGLVTMIPIILLASTFEELGWRGYAMDSLRARFGMMRATLLFSVLWAAWHVPLFFIQGNYQHGLWTMNPVYVVNFFVSVLPAAVLMNWLYYRNNRSIPAGILFHMTLVATSEAFQTEQFTKCIVTAVLLVIALLVVATNRRLFSEEKKSFV